MPTPIDATGLALAAAGGDREALAELIRVTQADVWRFVAYLGGRDIADDLTQETFLRMLTALPRFGGRSSARSWLLSIAHHVVVDRVRSDRARPRPAALVEACVPGVGDASGEVAVQCLLERLDDARREAFVLTQLLGFSYAETARIVGAPVGTIRSRVARARADLVAELLVTTGS